MAIWDKIEITVDGVKKIAQAPQIISASRSTDIPAFYADWFFHRLKEGYCAWTNPFNGVKSYISFANLRYVVFWSKNPAPLLEHLDVLRQNNIGCYIQYTLNDYENDGLEKNVPALSERINTFKLLVRELGFGGVIWRFDPLILTKDTNIDILLQKIENIGDQLKGYTEKLVFSFADIAIYKKVKANLQKAHIPYIDWNKEDMKLFAAKLVELNKRKGWNYQLATCGEAGDFEGILHNHCIDDVLIIKRAYKDSDLMDFLKAKLFPLPEKNLFGEYEQLPEDAIIINDHIYAVRGNNKDKGQRDFCGCMKAKDIGQYNTCIHQCEYCYANSSKEIATENYNRHLANPNSDDIIG